MQSILTIIKRLSDTWTLLSAPSIRALNLSNSL